MENPLEKTHATSDESRTSCTTFASDWVPRRADEDVTASEPSPISSQPSSPIDRQSKYSTDWAPTQIQSDETEDALMGNSTSTNSGGSSSLFSSGPRDPYDPYDRRPGFGLARTGFRYRPPLIVGFVLSLVIAGGGVLWSFRPGVSNKRLET